MVRRHYVYIMSSPTRRLLTGMTGDIRARLRRYASAHQGRAQGPRLVFFEVHSDLAGAHSRREEIGRMGPRAKLELIEEHNAGWLDLAKPWFSTEVLPLSRTFTR